MLSSLKNFFLAFFISLLVFGTGVYFLLNFIEDTSKDFIQPAAEEVQDSTDETEETSETGKEPDELLDTSEFSAVIIGIDSGLSQNSEKKEADMIILANINAKTKKLMISPLSCDTKTEVKGYILRLGAVYAEYGAETLIQTVRGYTGISVDYYCVLDYKSIEKIFEIFGEMEFDMEFNIPMDMVYDPFAGESPTETAADVLPANTEETTNDYERIDLKSGKQTIDAGKAIQLLRYRNYSNDNFERMDMQIEFIKEMLKQCFTFENLLNAQEIYEKIKESVLETNMDAKDLIKYAETFFAVPEYTIVDVSYPGGPLFENGVTFFKPDIRSAVNRYKPYRKDFVDTEDIGSGENINSIGNGEIIE